MTFRVPTRPERPMSGASFGCLALVWTLGVGFWVGILRIPKPAERRQVPTRATSRQPTYSTPPPAAAPPVVAATVSAKVELPPVAAAEAGISGALERIFAALNDGNRRAAADYFTPELLDSQRKLDEICRPFNYRAHYIEKIVDRGDRFEAWVHILYKTPGEELASYEFVPKQNQYVLLRKADPLWMTGAPMELVDTGERFLLALREGATKAYEPLLSQSLRETGNVVQGATKGLRRMRSARFREFRQRTIQGAALIEVRYEISMFNFANVYFEKIDGDFKVVALDFPTAANHSEPDIEDPEISARARKRFGLETDAEERIDKVRAVVAQEEDADTEAPEVEEREPANTEAPRISLPPAEYQLTLDAIGLVLVERHGRFEVGSVNEHSPAERASLQPGDIILRVQEKRPSVDRLTEANKRPLLLPVLAPVFFEIERPSINRKFMVKLVLSRPRAERPVARKP